ncbi:myelin-oligodendrocyte glycoprotein-like [Perca flavescens]|uniref:myelin-oligodendrocyte glycoprotein-like n=1 Tax=Perca flavescens TaxID=8167 RepID=UPI00106E4B6B|nr:myelin-oligodendrocyte glycoprotein-like [Perca flavescens]
MAPLLLLLFLLSEAVFVIVVTVHPGDDATLPCEAAESSIRAVEWTRDILELEYVLFYSDGYLETDEQHPSYKGRVELVDRDLKDGDVSLTLKNVNINDQGIYECRVASGGSRRKKRANIDSEPIRTIWLDVTVPGSNSRRPNDGNSSPVGLQAGLGVGGSLLLVAVAVVCVLIYKRHKDKRSGAPAAAR